MLDKLDKKAILETLNIAAKETLFSAHQNLGKNSLAEHLSKAILKGDYDAKYDDSSENDNIEKEA